MWRLNELVKYKMISLVVDPLVNSHFLSKVWTDFGHFWSVLFFFFIDSLPVTYLWSQTHEKQKEPLTQVPSALQQQLMFSHSLLRCVWFRPAAQWRGSLFESAAVCEHVIGEQHAGLALVCSKSSKPICRQFPRLSSPQSTHIGPFQRTAAAVKHEFMSVRLTCQYWFWACDWLVL